MAIDWNKAHFAMAESQLRELKKLRGGRFVCAVCGRPASVQCSSCEEYLCGKHTWKVADKYGATYAKCKDCALHFSYGEIIKRGGINLQRYPLIFTLLPSSSIVDQVPYAII